MSPTVSAAVIPAPNRPIEIRELPRPGLEPDSALLRVQYSEVCGTDVHLQHGRLAGVPYPLIPGHVSVGTIEAVRGRVVDVFGRPVAEGTPATFLDVHRTCGECWYCLVSKASTRCPQRKVYGITYGLEDGWAGGWCEVVYLRPGTRILPLDGVSPERFMAGGCGLPTAFHAVERAEIGLGETALILGSGPVGLSAIALARARGATRVLAIGSPARRLAIAARMGADHTLDVADHDVEQRYAWVRDHTAGRGPDVAIEATGVPEAGARHALEAIRHGKHVAMVNKETDVTVGPMLKSLADDGGLVYTAVDGDQQGLIMGLVAWSRELGLEVLCGGKFRNAEIVYDPANRTLRFRQQDVPLPAEEADLFNPIPPGQVERVVQGRRTVCANQAAVSSSDLGEMAITANATGLLPDVDTLHRSILRVTEIPEVLCPKGDGGLLDCRGAVEEIICLRHPWEAGTGGGCFIVVACDNAYSREILTTKGLIPNSRNTSALIYRPYHLCGVETPMSILCAGLLGVPTGTADYQPRVDLIALASEDLSANEVLDDRHTHKIGGAIRPAQPVTEHTALPFYMAVGNTLAANVPAGTALTATHLIPPDDSTLWPLRMEQDQYFLK